MSRFDDDLRKVAAELADEPMPPGMLDDDGGAPPIVRPGLAVGWISVLVGAVVVAVGIGWAIGRQPPAQAPSASAAVVASPDPTNQPVRHQVESDGVRVTVELETDRAREGVPMLATTTVENVGDEPFSYPVSSTCEWAVGLTVRAVQRFADGRDWDGRSADLKRRLLGAWGAHLPPNAIEDFTPYLFVDEDRLPDLHIGCFADAGRREIPAGASQTDKLAWRPIGPFGMPMPSGTYEVTATFERIAADIDDVHNRDRSDDVSMSFEIEIEGSSEDLLMPGEAIDVFLEDARVQAVLDAARPERWIRGVLEYADGWWTITLPISKPDAWLEPLYVVTADIDARSGALLRLRGTDDPR